MSEDLKLMQRFLAHVHRFNMRYFHHTDHLNDDTQGLFDCSFASEFILEDLDQKIFFCKHCKNRYQLVEPTWRETLNYLDKIYKF